MLECLITSKTRIKLMLKFFINPSSESYLRALADEMGESTNAVRVELNRFAKAGLLQTEKDGNRIKYKANDRHALFPEIQRLVLKYTGIDQLVDSIIDKMGDVELALITGDYAQGIDSGLIDLVVVGSVDKQYLQFLIDKTEKLIKRKIRTLVLEKEEFDREKDRYKLDKALIIWTRES